MKMAKDELVKKVNEMEIEDDKKISLLEDISDSFIEPDTKELDDIKEKYEELKEKYKERFMESNEVPKEEKEEELKEEKYIDIREI